MRPVEVIRTKKTFIFYASCDKKTPFFTYRNANPFFFKKIFSEQDLFICSYFPQIGVVNILRSLAEKMASESLYKSDIMNRVLLKVEDAPKRR